MGTDPRYATTQVLIEVKHITEFRQIFKTIPKSTVAKDMGTNNNRLSYMIENPLQMRGIEVEKIAKLINIHPLTIHTLIYNQINSPIKKSKSQ
jgi:hypothetical protein